MPVEMAIAGWVDGCNCRRLHGTWGSLAPVESEMLPLSGPLSRSERATMGQRRSVDSLSVPELGGAPVHDRVEHHSHCWLLSTDRIALIVFLRAGLIARSPIVAIMAGL